VAKLQVMVSESKAELWDSITYFAATTQIRIAAMSVFRISFLLLIPFLAMTEGGGMYQRLVNVPLWQTDMSLMKLFHQVGPYFFIFSPIVLVLWITLVVSGWRYAGKAKTLLAVNHFLYLSIIISTALYFIPFLSKYVANAKAIPTNGDYQQLQQWANYSLIRQIVGFSVIGIYTYIYGIISKENLTTTRKRGFADPVL
jgi:hypothetical protein